VNDSSDDEDGDDNDDARLPAAVSEDLLGEIDENAPIHQFISSTLPWLEDAMTTELKEDPQNNLINFDDETTLFTSPTTSKSNQIFEDLMNLEFGEFVVPSFLMNLCKISP
jgi:hypothetical protein